MHNFGDSLDDNLRDQLIEKLPDIELKKKLLETRNITLAQVLEKTRASEAAGQQVKHMAGVSDVMHPSIPAAPIPPPPPGQLQGICTHCQSWGSGISLPKGYPRLLTHTWFLTRNPNEDDFIGKDQ